MLQQWRKLKNWVASKLKKKTEKMIPWWLLPVVIAITLAIVVVAIALNKLGMYELKSDILTLISVIVAVWTLIATIVIAIYIYNRQKKDSEAEDAVKKNTALEFMGIAVEDAVHWLIAVPASRRIGPCYRIREYLNRYEDELADVFSHEELKLLSILTETFDVAVHDDEADVDCSFLFRDWICPIMNSSYREYASCALNEFDLLNEKMYQLLQRFGIPNTREKYRDLTEIHDANGKILFKRTSDIPESLRLFENSVYDIYEDQAFWDAFQKYECALQTEREKPDDFKIKSLNPERCNVCIYDGNGQLAAMGELDYNDLTDDIEIMNGFTRNKHVSFERYTGLVVDFKPSGLGIEYGAHGEKVSEGYWKEGEFAAGIECGWVVKDEYGSFGLDLPPIVYEYDGEMKLSFQIQRNVGGMMSGLKMMTSTLEQEGLEHYYICDIKVVDNGKYVAYYNIEELENFLRKNEPRLLEMITEFGSGDEGEMDDQE